MRPLAELRFIRDRVLAEVRANPCPPGEMLGAPEPPEPPEPSAPCRPRGHTTGRGAQGQCLECDRMRKRRA